MVNKGAAIVCAGIAIFVILLVSVILMGVSYGVVDINKVGILKDSISKAIESDKIYLPGRY